MNCPRCGGLMVNEWVSDLQNFWTEGEEESLMSRCLSCGELVDPLVLVNRSSVQSSHVH